MAARYAKGLVFAFLMLGAVLAAIVVPTALSAGRPLQLLGFFDVWLGFGLPTLVLLGVAVGPVVLVIQRFAGDSFTRVHAAVVGAAAGPLFLFAVWLLYREGNETVGGLLQFWVRLPAEFVLGVLPYTAAGALFAGWVVAGKPRRRESAR